ncbi:hypothetical protein SAMN02745207_01888 [Clostridium grantii DSM 8605]|uniref:Uncharacterized protein n=2 Tax=Clostridium TaxID=1485 RepID=A0A1M5UTI6_9CLOT|nr:hypothetical protein SAMN02745207_01888 [Clostridium grantii DSM 8605]
MGFGHSNTWVMLMIKKISVVIVLLIMFLQPKVISAKGFKYVEIFDPKQEKVVKVVQLNSEINDMVSSWVKNVDSLYGIVDPITDDGYALRIPLDPPINVETKCLKGLINEVFILIPEKQPPFFMVFENESKVNCFSFDGNIDELSKALDFELK